MTDEELMAALETVRDGLLEVMARVAGNASGQIRALQVAIRALQSQPGYSHDRFLSDLARYDAVLGDMQWQSDVQRQAFADELVALSTEPGLPPPAWLPLRE